jgi:hypothetical protein
MFVPNRAHDPARKQGDHTTPTSALTAGRPRAEGEKETNSAGGSKWQLPASKEAERISNSWMNTPAHRYAHEAVVWTQAGQRLTGTHVTPGTHPETGESGIRLHSLNTGATFHKDSEISEVHFVEKPGMPSSSVRHDTYNKEQAARKQTVE